MDKKFNVLVLNTVDKYLNELSLVEKSKIEASFSVLENGDFKLLNIRHLRGDIKELKIKRHRIIFFIHKNTICFVDAFVKKTQKTPKRKIENALKIYKEIIKLI